MHCGPTGTGGGRCVRKIRRRVPVTEYLRLQKRFAHLFGDPPDHAGIAAIQAIANANIEEYGLLGPSATE